MAMNYKATLMTLVLVSSALAGCTGDPDGGGGDEIDSDALQDLFDEHFQDFLNNTTITVINNYHNNTTYVIDDSQYTDITNNDYNNTTTVEGGEVINNYNEYDSSNTSYNFGGASFGTGVNGTVTGGNMMFVAHVTFTAMDLFPDYETADYRNNTFTYNYTYYDYLTNQERTEDFTFSCQEFYLIGSLSNGSTFQVSYWDMAANGSGGDNYWNAWDNEYNSTIADLLEEAGWAHDVRSTCDEGYIAIMPIKDGSDGWEYNFLSIDIPQGYAIEYLQLSSEHSFYGCGYWLPSSYCTDPDYSSYSYGFRDREVTDFYNWSEGVHPGSQNWYYGGWENITIDFDIKFNMYDGTPPCTYCGSGYGAYSVWPTSMYEFTLYYQFVPVMPVE
jgi:hypothetical protein